MILKIIGIQNKILIICGDDQIELTQELVKNLFKYKNGELYRKIYKNYNAKIGDNAKIINGRYYKIGIDYKQYKLHQIIFLYHHGYFPKQIDHIDRNPLNNNIENLRETTQSQNNMNRTKLKNCSSQYKGVTWNKNLNKWQVSITINRKRKHLGLFTNETDAAIAYNEAAIKLFKEYANLNEV